MHIHKEMQKYNYLYYVFVRRTELIYRYTFKDEETLIHKYTGLQWLYGLHSTHEGANHTNFYVSF
jgi:hypothetical protein